MRTILLPAVALSAAFLLSACGGSDSSSADAGQNGDVCTQFATAYNDLSDLTKAGPADAGAADQWAASKQADIAQFSSLSDKASGTVKDDLSTLVSALPADSLELAEPDSESGKALVDNASAVSSSCTSDGTSITLAEFPLLEFN